MQRVGDYLFFQNLEDFRKNTNYDEYHKCYMIDANGTGGSFTPLIHSSLNFPIAYKRHFESFGWTDKFEQIDFETAKENSILYLLEKKREVDSEINRLLSYKFGG